MILFLTSSFIPYRTQKNADRTGLVERNGFAEQLRGCWPDDAHLLFFASDPDGDRANDIVADELRDTLENAGLKISEMRLVDRRESGSTKDLLKWADVIFLAGGHAPTQLAFMRERKLGQYLRDFEGIVIGLSAGSVNAANMAYLMPELPGESISPNYERFLKGLGLTPLNIIPHRDYILDLNLDGKRYVEDILLDDSYGRRFYMISDGSYFMIRDGITRFFGEGEIIENGLRQPLTSSVVLPQDTSFGPELFINLCNEDGYDAIFTIGIKNGDVNYHFVGARVEQALADMSTDYDEMCRRISAVLVEEESEPFIEQTRLKSVLDEIKERGSYVRTIHVDAADGRRAKVLRISHIPGNSARLMGSMYDISAELDHDWMTDEYARVGFMEKAMHIINSLPEDEECSLIYTNIKGFKAINELFGNQSGDMVIFQARDVLRKVMKPLILGRLESDHFVLIAKNSRLTPRRFKMLTGQTYATRYKEYNFDIRCGIYRIDDREISIDHMIDRAKLAEKQISDDRGVSYAYYDDMVRENYVKQQLILSDMSASMERGEFNPNLQPIVDVGTGRIVSAEALIRWNHRDMGMVSPADFIPIIENGGRVSALDYFMLDRIIDFLSGRIKEGKRVVPCAVNLSRIDFYDPMLMDHLENRLREMKELPSLLRIEVTESAYTDLESRALSYLNSLKKMGVKVLLDDFGSGMSSLATLEKFDFNIVKLDIGFISRIGVSKKSEAIICATIALAHAMGAKVAAEGVETEKQLEFLKNADCDYIQGYYFYRPVDVASFADILDGENG